MTLQLARRTNKSSKFCELDDLDLLRAGDDSRLDPHEAAESNEPESSPCESNPSSVATNEALGDLEGSFGGLLSLREETSEDRDCGKCEERGGGKDRKDEASFKDGGGTGESSSE
jgi:hypothetical protein